MQKIIGPFYQLLTMANLPERGALQDEQLEIIANAGIVVEGGKIKDLGSWESLKTAYPDAEREEIDEPMVLLPGFVDTHTHICSAGNRATDYAMRLAGKSYLEIAEAGGGIWHTVTATRSASLEELTEATIERAKVQLSEGVTTCEVKSGYGLTVESELKMLRAIQNANKALPIDLVGTCLAAHMKPKDFEGTASEYLQLMADELLPKVWKEGLACRVDAFVEQSAFSVEETLPYLQKAKELGFDITVHGDQFTPGGSQLAIDLEAISTDHLEASTDKEVEALAKSNVTAVALPGATIGLGDRFTPARAILDKGGKLAIATDWNPGSAPMGKLLLPASILGAFEHLTMAETLAGLTIRAAAALNVSSRVGSLEEGKLADFIAFPFKDFRNIIYRQGAVLPKKVWKRGEMVL
ncbi:imidazolonepropionase [Balneicella halophila]|uniref:Imidazolonepropionase n=1 Tax=Balneicella halophila TaxID=1537566 RepID=A0A7L4UQT6_BALHA|nr:imidazolonepropionase [Balneicella halophila]PVX52138.1 imidazolonepropionase [Balneicella halophila]